MPSFLNYLFVTIIVFLLLPFAAQAKNEVEVYLPVRNLAENELGQLHVSSYGAEISGYEKKIQGNGFTLEHWRSFDRLARDRRLINTHIYLLKTTRPGTFTTPPLTVQINGSKVQTATKTFKVHELRKFSPNTLVLNDKSFTYYSASFAEKADLFTNEASRIELRYLIPRKINLEQWGTTTPDKYQKVAAWRLDGPLKHRRNAGYSYSTSFIRVDDKAHTGASYHSTLTGISPGKGQLGPFKANCVFTISKHTRFGMRNTNIRKNLIAAPIDVTINPLPPGAPEGFQGTVGEYELSTTLPDNDSISLDNAIKLSLTISGKGNLQNIGPPKLESPDDWKLIDVTKDESQEQRKSIYGNATFHFLVSPLTQTAKTTPSFSFAYFNPTTSQYERLYSKTRPISILDAKITSTANLPESIEQQKSVLGFLSFNDQLKQDKFSMPFSWHWLPSILALTIIIFWLLQKRRNYLLRNTRKILISKDLSELKSTTLSAIEFYKKAGAFIEQWIHKDKRDKANDVLIKRDEHCYLPKEKQAALEISNSNRTSIIKLLKSLALLLLLCGLGIPHARANSYKDKAQQLTEQGEYEDAIKLLNQQPQLTANGHYNLAVSYFKTNQIGLAALEFHRALHENPDHPEAKQNLAFISEEFNHPKRIEERNTDKWVSKLNKNTYFTVLWAGVWFAGLLLLLKLLIKPRRLTPILFFVLVTSGFSASLLSVICIQLYPKSIYFGQVEKLAVIITEQSFLRTEPINATSSKEKEKLHIVDLPTGSLCKIIAKRAQWVYIELPSQTRGWIDQDSVRSILVHDLNQIESALP